VDFTRLTLVWYDKYCRTEQPSSWKEGMSTYITHAKVFWWF